MKGGKRGGSAALTYWKNGCSNIRSLKTFLFSWTFVQVGILIKMEICLTGGAISQLCTSGSSLVAWCISMGTTHGSLLEDKM